MVSRQSITVEGIHRAVAFSGPVGTFYAITWFDASTATTRAFLRTRISQRQRYRWTDHELQQPATAGLGAAIYRIAVVLTEQAVKSFFPLQQLVNQDQALNRGTATLRRTFALALQ
jgi:hypothetical protein